MFNQPGNRWVIWLIVSVFSLFQFFLQVATNMMAFRLAADFHLTDTGLGLLSSAFFYTYVITQIPAGLLLDRFNVRKVLMTAVLLCGVGCVGFALSQHFWQAFVSRLLMGMGASFGFVGMIFTIAEWFSLRNFALLVGFGEFIGMAGTSLAERFVPYLIISVDWRNVMLGCAALAGLIFLAKFVWLKDRPKHRSYHLPFRKQLLSNLKLALRIKAVWLAGVYCCGMFAVVSLFAALWGVPYLETVHRFSYLAATDSIAWMLLGIALGAPSIGWLAGRTGKLKPLMQIACLITLSLLLIMMFTEFLLDQITMFLLFIVGFTSSGSLLAFSVVERATKKTIRGISLGLCNALALMGAVILQPLAGWIITALSQNFHFDQAMSYQLALLVLPVILLIGLLAASTIKLSK